MKRSYKKQSIFDAKRVGQFAFTLFIVFIAYKILTPPSDETAHVVSPDGSKTARLRTFYYYDNQPSYKIYYRETGKKVWLNLLYLPAYTNESVTNVSINWGPDSEAIFFNVNNSNIWHHSFKE